MNNFLQINLTDKMNNGSNIFVKMGLYVSFIFFEKMQAKNYQKYCISIWFSTGLSITIAHMAKPSFLVLTTHLSYSRALFVQVLSSQGLDLAV